jgi:hypothetical protein
MEENSNNRSQKPWFWTTLPGLITALAALLTALGGVLTLYYSRSPTQPANGIVRSVNNPRPEPVHPKARR